MITVAIPDDLANQFRLMADATGQTLEQCIQGSMQRFLEEMEDRIDAEEADRLYAEFKASGETGIPWEQVKAELDLKHGV